MTNIYQQFYDLLNNYIFGSTVVPNTYEDLICIIISTVACLLLVALPFVIVWRVIRVFL